MTEYDYSPEAWERYLSTQTRIARWVDGTLQEQPCNAFTPATPAVQALALQKEKQKRHQRSRRGYDGDPYSDDDNDSLDRHDRPPSSRRSSKSHHHKSSRRQDRSRSRSRERSYKDATSPTRPKSSRHRSSSYSSPNTRPQSSRSHTAPVPGRNTHLSLDLPPFPTAPMPSFPTVPSPKDSANQYYPQRYSGHSSHSSTTLNTRPHSGSTSHNGHFPPHQLPHHLKQPPYSAPPVIPAKPMRAQTMPVPAPYAYGGGGGGRGGYTQIDKNGYPVNANPATLSQPIILPLRNGAAANGAGVPINPYMDPSKAPQLPYSAYQYHGHKDYSNSNIPSPTKQVPLLRRLFGGLGLGGGKHGHSQSQSYSREREQADYGYGYMKEKEGSMFLGGGQHAKGMRRKRSSSF